jgi:uncharacterized protein
MGKKSAQHKESLLWRVDPGQGLEPSYVLGTMHSRDSRVHAFVPGIMPYLTTCRVLATEFPLIGDHLPPMPDHLAVEDWTLTLSSRKRRLLEKILQRYELGPSDRYRHLPPLFLSQILTAELLGKESEHPLDLALAISARQAGLELDGVETLDEQWDILRHIPVAEQRRQLLQMAGHFSRFRRQLKKQVGWYLRQDIRQLYQDARRQLKGMRKTLLLDRNRIMAIRMGQMARESPHFFAIGAAHLAGGKGVLRLLKRQGFAVSPVTLSRDGD